MKDRNEYGHYSSGYIYDRLCRSAIQSVKKQLPELSNHYIRVQYGRVDYRKNIIDLDSIKVFTETVDEISDRTFNIANVMRKHSMPIAYGFFEITIK